MSTTSKTKFAILGMLVLNGPCSGYDIKKRIEESIGYFWNESYGNLYPILRRLQDEGLATCEVEVQTGRPNRNVYTVTDKGVTELQAWLSEPPDPQPIRNELLLKVFYGRQCGAGTVREHVRASQHELQGLLGALERIEQQALADGSDSPDFTFGYSTLRLGLMVTRARLQWCEETLERLRTAGGDDDDNERAANRNPS